MCNSVLNTVNDSLFFLTTPHVGLVGHRFLAPVPLGVVTCLRRHPSSSNPTREIFDIEVSPTAYHVTRNKFNVLPCDETFDSDGLATICRRHVGAHVQRFPKQKTFGADVSELAQQNRRNVSLSPVAAGSPPATCITSRRTPSSRAMACCVAMHAARNFSSPGLVAMTVGSLLSR